VNRPVPSSATRAAAVLHVALGIGFGIGAAVTVRHLERTGELPMTPFGFRSLSGGPFEDLPQPTFVALAWGLVIAGALDVVTGAWLWRGDRRGWRLSLVTSPVGFVLAIGFALPLLLIGIPVRLALLAIGRRKTGTGTSG
jgi:hypothetical protein